MYHKDGLVRDSAILFAATSVANAANFVFHMYATRTIGPEGYGILATMLAMLIIAGMPANALQMSIVRKTSACMAHNKPGGIEALFKHTFLWFLGLGFVYFLLFTASAGLIAEFFNIQDKALVYILGAIAMMSIMMPLVRGILQGMQKFLALGLNNVLDTGLRLLFLIVFVSMGFGVRGALATSFFAALCAFVAGIFVFRGIFSYREDHSGDISKRELLKYAMPVFLAMGFFSLLSYMDLLMVKHFFKAEEAGFSAVTSIIGKAFLFFPSAIVMSLFPKAASMHELNEDARKLLMKSLLLTAGISALGIIFCAVFPKFVLWALTGGDKYYAITGIVRVFGAAILPLVLINVVINYSLAVKKYGFIYVMLAGVILYGALLWNFHSDFITVITIMFFVTLAILAGSLMLIYLPKRKNA